MVKSSVDFNMLSSRKKKQQNKRLLKHLSESDTIFVIGQSNHEAQIEGRANVAAKNTSLNNINDPTQVNGSEVGYAQT